MPSQAAGSARPIRFRAVMAACRTSPSSSPSRSRRAGTAPGRADAAQGGRGLEANGRFGVLEPGEEAVAGFGHAAGPELPDSLGPNRGVAVVHGVEDGGPGGDPAVDGVEGPDRVPAGVPWRHRVAESFTSGGTASLPRSARRRCATILTLRAGWERPRTSSSVDARNSRPIAAGMYQAGLGAAALAPR